MVGKALLKKLIILRVLETYGESDKNTVCLPRQLIRCVGGTAFVGQIGAKRGELRNFYYDFTTFEKSNRKMLYV